MQRRIVNTIRLALVAGSAIGLSLGAIPAAHAANSGDPLPSDVDSSSVEEQLDPATYQGNLSVATDHGDVVVSVEAGEAALFLNRADGSLDSLSTEAAQIVEDSGISVADAEAGVLSRGEIGVLAACGIWMNAVAGPGVYWETVDGCAVAGYPGYYRGYSWATGGTYLICAQARGWNPGATWYGVGCSDTSGGGSVPWGNSLAYTKMRANAIVTVSPIGYSWRT